MSDKSPVPWTPVLPDELKNLPRADHTGIFSRDEVHSALLLLAPGDEAATIAEDLYSDAHEPGEVFFYGDLLSALSTLSDCAAERVRSLLNETPVQAAARISTFLDQSGEEKPTSLM